MEPTRRAGAAPRIQYAQTADGVSIAYYTVGEGTPLVSMPNLPFNHIQLEWQLPEFRSWLESLSRGRKLVRYDGRGHGMSDRDVSEFSIDAHVRDLEAVVERLGLERFVLYGFLHSGPVAIAYAARHPERVSHLLLWCSYASGADYQKSSELPALRSLLAQNWTIYTETVSHALLGWSVGEPARAFAALMRECVTPEVAEAALAASRSVDVVPLLPQVQPPTLVLHRRQAALIGADIARALASRIPNARLAQLEGTSLAPFLGDSEGVAAAIDEFLSEGDESAATAAAQGAFRTVLFTDVEGSTALTDRLGDARARELMREHERIVREALKTHGGSEVKTMGDGFMASFSSATRALECAIAVQRAFAEHNESADEPISVRVGLNAGEPIAEDEDLYGTTVNLAARIASHARGGEILASEGVRQIVAGKRFLLADRGETELRGFEDPVRLYEVSWRPEE